jgi:hypothetical protein
LKFLFGNALTPREILETILTALCILVAFVHPQTGSAFFTRIEGRLKRLAARPWLAMAVVGLLPVVLRAVILPFYPVPTPAVHDEYGFLLLADTFASGRITNPPHPLWQHFESIYILNQPTYTAQYQIAQGLLLAVGKLAGNPWIGVLVSVGVLCALLVWMLRAWLPPQWALAGGLIAVFQFGVLSYWMNSYFGGAVPAIGGTLVLGALPRLKQSPFSYALVLAAGEVLLMNSRPLEAFLLGLVVAGVVLRWVFVTREVKLMPVALPVSAALAAAVAFMGYYNWRVTGHATELPYALYQKTYGTPQGFFWQPALRIASFRSPQLEAEYLQQLKLHERSHSVSALAAATAGKFRTFWGFYLGPALLVPLVFLPWIWAAPGMGLALAVAVLFGLDYLTFFAFLPQYAAPICGVILLVILQCLRRLRDWRGPTGLFLARALPLVCVVGVIVAIAGRSLEPVLPASAARLWRPEFAPRMYRTNILDGLLAKGGQHLVIVSYAPDHQVDTEWVYNDADIDRSPVVWARAINPQSNRKLLEYFRGRTIWLAEPDANPPRLTPYPKEF